MSTTETVTTDVRGDAFLSDSLSSDGIYQVHGVAIGPDETTTGMSGQKKFWPAEALEEAAETLSGKNIVKNHVNSDVDAVVGAVTEARFHPEYGVIYKGELDDEELATKVSRDRLDVSPRIIHGHVDDLEENDDGALVVDEVKEFVNLALVPQGAAESNEIEIGHSGLLSMSHADLREALGDGEDDNATADDLDDESLDIEDPVKSSEESAQESGDDLSADDVDDGCDEECSASAESEPEVEEIDDADNDESAEESVLSKIEVLGADSRDDADIDLTKIELLN